MCLVWECHMRSSARHEAVSLLQRRHVGPQLEVDGVHWVTASRKQLHETHHIGWYIWCSMRNLLLFFFFMSSMISFQIPVWNVSSYGLASVHTVCIVRIRIATERQGVHSARCEACEVSEHEVMFPWGNVRLEWQCPSVPVYSSWGKMRVGWQHMKCQDVLQQQGTWGFQQVGDKGSVPSILWDHRGQAQICQVDIVGVQVP